MAGGGLRAIQRDVPSHGLGLALEIPLRVASQRQPAIEGRVRPAVGVQPALEGARGFIELAELIGGRAEIAPAIHGKMIRLTQQARRRGQVAARQGGAPGALHQVGAPEQQGRGMFEGRGRLERATRREGRVGAANVRVHGKKHRGRDQSDHSQQNEESGKKRAHVAGIISVEWQYNCIDMGSLSNQIFSFMTSQQGSVIYHILLVSSIAFGLQSAFNHWRSSDFPQARRTMVGLGILLLVNILMFIVSGLGWQQALNLNVLLPPLDRAFVLLGLVWVTWLWAFPEPSNAADSAAALLSLLIASIAVLSLADQTALAQPSFNATLQDGLWQVASIGVTPGRAVAGGVHRGDPGRRADPAHPPTQRMGERAGIFDPGLPRPHALSVE